MNYRNRLKERNTRKILLNIFAFLRFTGFNLSFSSKIVVIGSFISLASLFFPWILKSDENLSWSSFSAIGGNIGYLMIILLVFLIFIVTSINFGEKIKLASSISFKNYIVVILSGFFIITVGIIFISFINGLNTFLDNINVGKGIILYMLSGIVILIGGIMKRSEYKKKDYESFINETKNNENMKISDSNMKLPF